MNFFHEDLDLEEMKEEISSSVEEETTVEVDEVKYRFTSIS